MEEGLVKTQIAGSSSRVFDPVGLGWGLRIWISNKVPSDADVADLEITLWELLT